MTTVLEGATDYGFSVFWEKSAGRRVMVWMNDGEYFEGEIPIDWFNPKNGVDRLGTHRTYEKVDLKVSEVVKHLLVKKIRKVQTGG